MIETVVKVAANIVGYVSIMAIVGDGDQPPAGGLLTALSTLLGVLAALLIAAIGDRYACLA